jgi:hypothetical protein
MPNLIPVSSALNAVIDNRHFGRRAGVVIVTMREFETVLSTELVVPPAMACRTMTFVTALKPSST